MDEKYVHLILTHGIFTYVIERRPNQFDWDNITIIAIIAVVVVVVDDDDAAVRTEHHQQQIMASIFLTMSDIHWEKET